MIKDKKEQMDECERIAKIIDPDNTFLDECEGVLEKRWGENFRKETEK